MPDPTGRVSHLPDFHRGVSWKQPVRVATTANGTLSTAFANGQTVDGITLATGDRILLKNQSTGSQNGIYTVAASGAPTRAFDMDQDGTTSVPAEEVMGAFVYVIAGTTNGATFWYNTNTTAPTLGTTALTFSQFSGGTGLSDPMTTRGDVIVRNASNVTARLAIGAAGKILSSDGTDVSWGNGPMTTQDDIIVGGASGIPTRLAKGADSQVLTVDPTTHHLVWATSASGFSNPMTTKGDIIVGDTGGTAIRKAVGSDTQVLTADSASTGGIKWAAAGAGSGNLTAPSSVSVDLGASNLLVRQAVVNTEDDLFDASSLAAKWLAYTGYNATTDLTVKPGWCKITGGGAKLQAVPAGDWTVEGEFLPPAETGAAFSTAGLVLTNGTSQGSATEARFAIGQPNSAGSTRVFAEKFINGAFSTTFQQQNSTVGGVVPQIIRVVKSGTNFTVQFGATREGLQYFALVSALGFTPTHFGFHGDVGSYINSFYRI